MKALVKYACGDGNVDIMDVEEPLCGENQVKVEVAFCGVCGTDIHVVHDTFRNYPPVILGHEFAGRAVEVGRSVIRVAPGDAVTVLGATAVTCGQCPYCRSGHFIFCSSRRGMGHGVNGAFTRYVVVRPDQVYRIPAGLTLEEAALCEPFAAAVQAVTEVTQVRIGDTALISGPGPIGLLCLKLLVDHIFYKQLTLAGSVCYTARTWDSVMEIFAQGRVRLTDLISAKLPLSEWRKGFDVCVKKEALKVLLYPEG